MNNKTLGHISGYKANALFTDNIMLTSRIGEERVYIELEDGMVFATKGRNKSYYVYNASNDYFICLNKGVNQEEPGTISNSVNTGYNDVMNICQYNDLVYCPNKKAVFGVANKNRSKK